MMATTMQDFPLPQELKDEIYSYLLHADIPCKLESGSSDDLEDLDATDFRPHLETAILHVSKSIGADAARYFYSQNSFIRISHASSVSSPFMSTFFDQFTRFGIHFCSIRAHDHIPHLAYSIHVCSPPEEYFSIGTHYGSGRLVDVLILERNVEKLWSFLSMASLLQPPDCVRVSSKRGDRLELSGTSLSGSAEFGRILSRAPMDSEDGVRTLNQKPPTVEIRAFDSKYVKLEASRKTAFYENACSALGNFFRVSFHGFNHDVVEHPRSAPSATISWSHAFDWSTFDAFLALKVEADEFAIAGQPLQAMRMYRFAEQHVGDWLELARNRTAAMTVESAAQQLQFDISFSIALLYFRLDVQPSHHVSGYVRNWRSTPHAPASRVEHFLAIDMICCNYALASNGPRTAALEEVLELLRQLSPSEMIVHDIEMIESILANQFPEDCEEAYEEPFEGKFSFAVFPFEIVDTVSALGHYHNRPEGLVGWLDIKHLAEFSEEDKKAVNVFQEERGLRITDWDCEEVQ